jgi:ABC-type Zn uptake system ZnuABC Zn-binding protein ZnuA
MDITQRIAGADARVALAMEVAKDGSGALTVRSQDKDILATASLAVLVGLGLDERLEKELKGLPKPPRFFKAGDRVPTLSIDGGDGPADPRVWMDPARMRLIVKALGEELARVDGAHAGAYRSRASALDEKLDGLEKELAQTMAPFEGRSVAVEGGTMLYFADRYALRVALRLPKGTALQSTGAPMVLLRDTQGGDPTESAATPGLTSYRIVPVNSFGDGPAPVYEEILRRGAAALTAAWRP